MLMVASGLDAGRASATSFSVNPTQVFLSGKTSSALLTLRNESADTLRFQLSVFAWNQSPQGDMQLTKTNEVIFFPALLTLAPNEERKVRVGTMVAAGTTERSYRIFVEELPPIPRPHEEAPTSVRVLTKMGIPIFVQPSRPVAQGTIREPAIRSDTFTFRVENTGTVHFVPQSVRVRGLDAVGGVLLDRQVEGWYILAGGSRVYELALPRPACTKIARLSVDVQVGAATLTERLETPPAACSP